MAKAILLIITLINLFFVFYLYQNQEEKIFTQKFTQEKDMFMQGQINSQIDGLINTTYELKNSINMIWMIIQNEEGRMIK
jgi:hypothetical protein